ncbi:carbohydrate-binding family 9-like protein [Paenibacillus sp. HWE-109]|uniref:carbohydrate-binding family 9-like protein n=1 Tax=Paenibacillus sp. HWE-109 TaxID=1306526 RepID=UPI001EE07871|nr:carbohydrate-binding family 9-like protein [Paenibacillus sp. HWE-109]UKS24259.1 carbohydrate-binding family 9-like protein [Paenibacillus sp. HWE-109]
MRYECNYVEVLNDGPIDWAQMPANLLCEVVTGAAPRLETFFRACWSEEAIHIRFECEDDHIVATMEQRDDPIYLEDVVEVFIDTVGTGKVYYEFEVSPRNVLFDAIIHNDLEGGKEIDISWDAPDWRTDVTQRADGWRVYDLMIPFADLDHAAPRPGAEWRWNLYRIDDDKEGNRHYWAWSPTQAVNFHVPQSFGTLVFVRA